MILSKFKKLILLYTSGFFVNGANNNIIKDEAAKIINAINNLNNIPNIQEKQRLLEEILQNYSDEASKRKELITQVLIRTTQSNSLLRKFFIEWIMKTLVVLMVQKLGELFFALILNTFEGKATAIREEYNTLKTLKALKILNEDDLLLSPEHRNLLNSIMTQINDIDRNKEALMAMQPLVIFVGVGGTGKTTSALLIQKYVVNNFTNEKQSFIDLLMKKLPFSIRAILGIHEDNKALIITLSGAYFFNQGDFEKGASLLNKMLTVFEEYILNHPERKVIIVLEEAETFFNVPQFITVLKDKISQFEKMHQATKRKKEQLLRQNGIILLILTTNYGEKLDSFFSRRAVLLSFGHPTELQKLNILMKFLNDILGEEYYTETIRHEAVNIVRLCSHFSPSDIENVVSMLGFVKNNLQNMVTLLDLLQIIHSTLLKMQAIVYKQDDNSSETITRKEVLHTKELIIKIETFYNQYFISICNQDMEIK